MHIWLRQFLNARSGLQRPDGRALFAYRISDNEFRALAAVLRDAVRSARLKDFVGAGICLYVAEWWRRCYEGGALSWESALAGIGWCPAANEVHAYVEPGLRYWKRTLHTNRRGREFLVTLACEGGFPLSLLQRQANSVRRFLRLLLEDIAIFGPSADVLETAAEERMEACLPLSYRKPAVADLACQLTRAVWSHFETLKHSGHENARNSLDSEVSGWRDKLPIALDDGAARAVLDGLVHDAVTVVHHGGRSLRLTRVLVTEGSCFRLERRVQIPGSVQERALAKVLGLDSVQLGRRFALYVRWSGRPRQALCYGNLKSGQTAYRLEASRVGDTAAFRGAALKALDLEIENREGLLALCDVAGAGRLSDLPWVFCAQPAEQGTFRLVAEGACRVRQTEALVLVQPDWDWEVLDGELEELNGKGAENRRLFRISGLARFFSADGATRGHIATACSNPEAHCYMVSGQRWSCDPAVFAGVPRVARVAETGIAQVLEPRRVEWRPVRGNDRWRPVSDICRGDVWLRAVVDDDTCFQTRVAIAPPRARVELQPQDLHCGAVILTDFETNHIGVVPLPDVSVSPQSGTDGVQLLLTGSDSPPATLTIVARWTGNRELRWACPYPRRGSCFLDRDGNRLPVRSHRGVDALAGLAARAVDPDPRASYSASFRLIKTHDAERNLKQAIHLDVPLERTALGLHTLDLVAVHRRVMRTFGLTADVGARAELSIDCHEPWQRGARLELTRFVGRVVHNRVADTYRIEGEGAGDDDRGMELEAIRLDHSADAIGLVPAGPGAWRFAATCPTEGVWLCCAREGDWYGWRPAFVPNTSNPAPSTSFQAASFVCDGVERGSQFVELMRKLAQDPADPSWGTVLATLDAAQHIPVAIFDALRALVQVPEACALVLLKGGARRFPFIFERLEEFPMLWATLPIAAWAQALRRHRAHIESLRLPQAFQLGMFDAADELLRDEMDERLPGFAAVVSRLKAQRGNREPDPYDALLGNPRGFAARRHELLAEEALNLQGRQALWVLDNWRGWPKLRPFLTRRRLPERLEALLLGSAKGPNGRDTILNLPVVAALAAVCNFKLPTVAIFHLQRVRDLDPIWFRNAYQQTLLAALAEVGDAVCEPEKGGQLER